MWFCSHSEKVEYLGTVEQKITINANDDSYKTTRKRVELAKQEEQKTRYDIYIYIWWFVS